MCVCVCVCVCIHIYIYTHTQTHKRIYVYLRTRTYRDNTRAESHKTLTHLNLSLLAVNGGSVLFDGFGLLGNHCFLFRCHPFQLLLRRSHFLLTRNETVKGDQSTNINTCGGTHTYYSTQRQCGVREYVHTYTHICKWRQQSRLTGATLARASERLRTRSER